MTTIHSSHVAIFATLVAFLSVAACSSSSSPASPTDASAPTAADGGPGESADDASSSTSTSTDAGPTDAADATSSNPTSDDAAPPDAAAITLTASDGGTTSFDLVSPARCDDENGRFLNCVIPPVTVDANPGSATTPLQSTVTFHQSGNCSSQYAVELLLSAAGAPSVVFHVEDGTATVKRNDDGAIDALSITDDSVWTSKAVYDDTCRMSVDVQMNVPVPPLDGATD